MSACTAPASDGMTLLLVDDDDVDIMSVRRALDELGAAHRVVVAHDGIEALEYLRGENGRERVEPPYVIVLDLNMPRMDGIEFLAELRGDPELAHSAVFVLTTSAAEKDRLAAWSHHVAGFITKDTASEVVRDAVRMIDLYGRVVQLPGGA